MVVRNPETLLPLYEADETAWLERSADLLRNGRYTELDAHHLAEYLADMAISERREVKSRLALLLMHLLKWEHQPAGRCSSWLSTILEQQRQLGDLLESRTLYNHASEKLPAAHADAVKQAAAETGLPRGTFPADCPWTLETMLVDPVGDDPPAAE